MAREKIGGKTMKNIDIKGAAMWIAVGAAILYAMHITRNPYMLFAFLIMILLD